MAEKELALCDECGSLFFKGSSKMMGLCPECAHVLYGYPNCDHHFQNGRCVNCYWDGSESAYIKSLRKELKTWIGNMKPLAQTVNANCSV